VTAGELPPGVRASAAAWADCLAGAMPKTAYLEGFGWWTLDEVYGFPRFRICGKHHIAK
jgi:hypothetical protein